MGRRIVVAVDEGEESMHALTWCLRNVIHPSASAQESSSGGDEGDVLVLLYARPPRLYYPTVDGTGYIFSTDIITSMEKYANELGKSVIAKAEMVCAQYPNVKVETKVKDGDPRDVICDVVDRLGADMLVVGSHGYGPIKRAFLGSVSSHCAQNVKCPVLIVKRPKS